MPSPDRHFATAAIFTQSTGLTPNSGDASLYIKSDNKAYIRDSTGTESAVSPTSANITSALGYTPDNPTSPRTPTAHKSTHATGGSDPLTAADIGAATSAQGAKADSALQSLTTGLTGATALSNIVQITQAGYNAIGTPSTTTLYVIVG